ARSDEIACAHRYRALEILRKSEVARIRRDLQPRIAAPVLVQNVEGSVARAIVERDDFDVAVGLREQRVELRAQIPSTVESAQSDRNERQIFTHGAARDMLRELMYRSPCHTRAIDVAPPLVQRPRSDQPQD